MPLDIQAEQPTECDLEDLVRAAHYGGPIELLEQSGDDRVIAAFSPVRVVTNA